MDERLDPHANLIAQLARLPGVGRKTAQRLSYYILSMDNAAAHALADSIIQAKELIHPCPVCFGYTAGDVCPICRSTERDRTILCVVQEGRDVQALERSRDYHGLYHVLGGAISPMEGIGPEDLHVKELMGRLTDVQEVILATNPDIEGEATASYLARLIKPLGIKVTRIAHGIPVGGELEYTDEVTLARALAGRREM